MRGGADPTDASRFRRIRNHERIARRAVAGLTAGGAYALLGVCAVFTYRLVAVVNFTGAAIGAAGTFA